MTDFWFTLGAAIIDPALLKVIDDMGPQFQRIQFIRTEIVDGAVSMNIHPAAGFLDGTSTTNMRLKLRDTLGAQYAPSEIPIISLYVAGKVCQLWNTSRGHVMKSISSAHIIFGDAARKANLRPPYRPRLAAILGVSLIDNALSMNLANPVLAPPHLKEFGISVDPRDSERMTVEAFAGDSALQAAQLEMLQSADWRTVCGQIHLFYPEFKRAAN